MATVQTPSIKIIPKVSTDRTHETVNIIGNKTPAHKQYIQVPNTSQNQQKIYQDSGGSIPGLKTIVVAGYVAGEVFQLRMDGSFQLRMDGGYQLEMS